MDIDVAKELIVLLSDAIELHKVAGKMKGIFNKKDLSNLIESKIDEIQIKAEDL